MYEGTCKRFRKFYSARDAGDRLAGLVQNSSKIVLICDERALPPHTDKNMNIFKPFSKSCKTTKPTENIKASLLKQMNATIAQLSMGRDLNFSDADREELIARCDELKTLLLDKPGDGVESVPVDCKAFAYVLKGILGPDPTPPNKNLKLLLTSGGIMPTSAPKQIEAYRSMVAAASGTAVLYLVDAK